MDSPTPALKPGHNPLLRLIAPYRGLPRSVYALFIATVVNGLGVFVFPFLALILTRRFGLTAKETGDILFFTTVAYIPGSFLGGKLADHFGRKRVMMVSQFLCAAMFIPCGFLNDPYLIAGFVVASVFFDGVTDPARTAMTTDVTTPENRQAAYSLIYLGHNLGFALGQMIAGFLFASAPSWLFWGNAMAAGAALVLVALFIPETKPSAEELMESLKGDSSEKAHEGGLISALLSRPSLVIFALLTTLYGFSYAQHRFALPLQAGQLFGDGGARLYGLVMSMNAVLVIALTTPIVALTKRFKPIANVSAAGLLFALGFGMLAFAKAPWLFFLSATVWTLGEILNATNEGVYVANHTPMSHRGRFNAILPLISGLGFTVSTPIAGRIEDAWGIPALWLIVGLASALAAFGLAMLGVSERRALRKRAAICALEPTPEREPLA
jgi:MFS family permease